MTLEMEVQLTQSEEAVPMAVPKLKSVKPQSNHEKEVCEELTDNGGLYDTVVKNMLQPGHEGELCGWLREMNLIRSSMNCLTESCNNKTLTWGTARSIDKYGWNCLECKKRQSLRDSSFFHQIKTDLKICIQIIVAWCQGLPSEIVESYLKIKLHIIKKAYEKLAMVAEKYVTSHLNEWILGSSTPDRNILIVDEFPGGYMTGTLMTPPGTNKKRKNNNCHTILCMAEVDQVPPRMWMHIIRANPEPPPSKNGKTQVNESKCGMVEEALKEICAHAKPGSILLANERARCCNYESLKELKDYTVISIEDLKRHDPPEKSDLLTNLETIWLTGIGICEDIQDTSRINGVQCLYVHLWKQRFAKSTANAFQSILQHITECHTFT